MRTILLLCVCLTALPTLADEFVAPAPGPAEVSRFRVTRSGTLSVRLDTMTGASWYLCSQPKRSQQAWCRFREPPRMPSGPAGRYAISEGAPLLLFDTVSGRAWVRCELPTPEKGEAWCQVDE